MKTNAARILDALRIPYELRAYDPGDEHLTAEKVARLVALPPEQVFKTLVVRGDKHGVAIAVIAATSELDPKALATLTGDRKIEPVALKEVTPLTGYVRGGVTALACKKDYPVWVDESMTSHERVAVSAGARGTQIVLAPDDYLRASKGKTGEIARARLIRASS
jgi:Cys-tRNA(Pro)/Cys-tRNA(Cys) deacylase